MKVLATAYACEPGKGSESGIGWNWARQIALRHDLWLVTRENNVAAVRAAAAAEGLDRMRVVGFDLPEWARRWKRGGRGAVAYFSLWQRFLTGFAVRLDQRIDFDVVQHLTFASSWIPSGLASLDKPFVWGPVGQHPRIPARFLPREALALRAAERAKGFARGGCARLDPAVRSTLVRADVILSLSRVFGDRVPEAYRDKVVPMLAAGVDRVPLDAERFQRGAGLRVLFAGRLVELKGVRMALEAFARLAAVDGLATFDICGTGPLRPALEARAAELGLRDRVRFHGQVDHEGTLARMRATDVFLFPSFEGAGMVVPEAMSAGCPVVCMDFGGPGEMTGDERGLRVPLGAGPSDTAEHLGQALLTLHRDEALRLRLARAARTWADDVAAWDAKGARLDELYARAIEHAEGRKRVVG